jgi:hypothetical protein
MLITRMAVVGETTAPILRAESFGDITDEIFTIMRRWIAEAEARAKAGEPKVTA